MNSLDIIPLALILVIAGGALWVGAAWVVRKAAARRVLGAATAGVQVSVAPADTGELTLLLQPGGRIGDASPGLRAMLEIGEKDRLDLEQVARLVRPSEAFFDLCSQGGQARLTVGGRPAEGSAVQLAVAGEPVMAVTLRFGEASAGGDLGSDILKTFSSIAEEISASLELEPTLNAIQRGVGQLSPAEYVEITTWDAESGSLTPFRFLGEPGSERKLTHSTQRYSLGEGYSGHVAQTRQPLLVVDVEARSDIHPAVDRETFPIRSYVGIPLLAGDQLVGTLEAGALERDAFQASDVAALQLLAGQAAPALRNAMRYQAEQRKATELSSLALLTQSFSSVRDPKTLFSRLVDSIAPLLPVEIMGFLLYNEVNRTLEGQQPIFGLPEQIVELYRVPIPPGSQAEQFLVNQDVIFSENAAESAEWEALGLAFLAQAASLRDTVLVPLTSGGKMLGYLQASNHKDGSTNFTPDEMRLLTIVSNQAAPIIENASLVMQTRQRAQRAEGLRRITSLASSAATLDEILQFSTHELCQLLQADLGAVLLVDAAEGRLKMHPSSLTMTMPLEGLSEISLPLDDAQFPFTATGKLHSWMSNNLVDEKLVIPFYQGIVMRWQIVSMISVPLIVRDRGIGELWFGSSQQNAFDPGEVQMISTAAGQLAGVAEQAFLRVQTDEGLQRRVDQLTALARIGKELSAPLDLGSLVQLVYNEALVTTRAECGTLMLFDLRRTMEDQPRVRFFTGDAPPVQFAQPLLDVLEQRQAMVFTGDALESTGVHDGIQSMLVVPVIFQGRPAGIILLHSKSAGHFDPGAIQIAQSLSDQAALALGNALEHEEQYNRSTQLKRELDTLTQLFQMTPMMAPDQPLEDSLAAIAQCIQTATPFQAVVFSLYDPETQSLRRVVGAGIYEDAWKELQSQTQPWANIQQLLEPQYRQGRCYYITADKSAGLLDEVHSVALLHAGAGSQKAKDTWDADDFLLIPLYGSQEQPLGLVSLDAPNNGRRPDRSTLDALELFAAQAAMLVETRRKVSALEREIDGLQVQSKRLAQSAESAQKTIPELLRRDLDQAAAIQNLQQQIERARAGLEMAEQTNRQDDPLAMLRTLAEELVQRFDMQVALIGELSSGNARLAELVGQPPSGVNPEALFGQRNPLRQVLQERKLLLVADLTEDKEWRSSPFLQAFGAQSMIGLPVQMSEGKQGAVLVIGGHTLAPFKQEDDQVFGQLSRQVSVGVQNQALLSETRHRLHEVNLLLEFTRKMDVLDTRSILRSLVEAVLEVLPLAQAGWVGIWQESEGCLDARASSGYLENESISSICYKETETGEAPLPLRVMRSGMVVVTEVQFARDYNLPSADLLLYRHGTGGKLPVSTLIVPLRRGEATLGVLVLDNFNQADAFNNDDGALAASLAQQAALALDSARLFTAAEERASQLQALTQVSGVMTGSLQREQLIGSLLDLLRPVLPYNTATLWLREGETLKVVSASGFADAESRVGIAVAVQDSSLFQTMIRDGQPLAVPDIRQDERFLQLEEAEYLSWLGIPLIAKSELVGVIALEKREPGFYSAEHLQAGMTFASQAAISLENARLFEESSRRTEELDERSQRLGLLNRLSTELGGSLDVDRILQITARSLGDALRAGLVSGVMVGENDQSVVETEWPRRGSVLPLTLPGLALLDRLKESQGVFTCAEAAREPELAEFCQAYPLLAGGLLVVPLITATRLGGWMVVQRADAYRFSSQEIELARTVANQAAVALQTARLYHETRRLTADLEQRVEERTAELRREHLNTETLLRVITELSNSLDIEQVMLRALSVLNDSVGAEQSLIILPFANRTHRAGKVLAGEDALDREVARWVVRRKSATVIAEIGKDERWTIPPEHAPAFTSLLAVPLVMGEEVLGALILLHSAPSRFVLEQVGLVEATARQFAITLNNAELFALIRDQAQNLGTLLREQQMEASRSRAILEAVADGVLVTDSSNRITLLNPSSERILEIKVGDLLGHPLAEVSGLLGDASQRWQETIQKWARDPSAYHDETYAERLKLDNGRVVAVTLAPVFFRSDFLATVSIFRDITHEVQVDRMKSEFVANVSHELRTPMTSIKGYVEVMLMGVTGVLSDQQQHFLKVIRNNTERLNTLVNDLLDVSRIESGRLHLDLQKLNLAEVAKDVLAEFQSRSNEEKRGIEFGLKAAPDLCEVMADPQRTRQVLASLVSNGYNYTPAGGHVTVALHNAGVNVQADVIDDGIGLSPRDQQRIFERFYRGDDPLVLATAGTGLGLPIAKIMIEMHGGKIWYASSGVRGEGSMFSFTLPAAGGN